MKEKENKRNVNLIFDQFIENIESIELFFDKFSIKALEEDKLELKEKKEFIEKTFIDTLGKEGFEKLMSEFDKTILETEDANSEKNKKSDKKTLSKKEINGEFAYMDKLLSIISKLEKKPTIQEKNYEILTNGVFLMLNNYFEFLFADLLSYHYISNTQIIEEKNISISLNDLKNYSSIDEAYNDFLFKEVEKKLLDFNFEQIKSNFTKLGVSLSEELVDWSIINEIRERRHIIVHNNSIVNKKYLTKTENKYKFKISDKVKVNQDYLKKSISEIRLAGVLLTISCWGKWDNKTSTDAIGEIMQQSFDFLMQDKPVYAKKVCEYIESNIKPTNDEEDDFIIKAKINHCIALKRLDDKTGLKKRLKTIRTLSMSPIFKIAKHLLSDEFKKAINIFEQAILVDDLTYEQYTEWPLFDEIREVEKYNQEITEIFKK